MKPLFNDGKKTSDYLLIIAVIMLAIIGSIFIYSASNYSALKTYGDSLYFVKKQLSGLVIGVVFFLFANLN